jgi:hypothetical protein
VIGVEPVQTKWLKEKPNPSSLVVPRKENRNKNKNKQQKTWSSVPKKE